MAYTYLTTRFGNRAPSYQGDEMIFDRLKGREIPAKRMWLIQRAYDFSGLKHAAFEAAESECIANYINHIRSKRHDTVNNATA